MERHDGNVRAAARAAEVDRVYLYRLLHKHGLRDPMPHARFHATIEQTTVHTPGLPNLLTAMIEEIEERLERAASVEPALPTPARVGTSADFMGQSCIAACCCVAQAATGAN